MADLEAEMARFEAEVSATTNSFKGPPAPAVSLFDRCLTFMSAYVAVQADFALSAARRACVDDQPVVVVLLAT